MANEVIMPKAGMSMETGTIVQWLVQEGEKVEQGDPLLEIETDKVNMEVESLYSGTLLKILYEAGDVIPVTQVIAYIGEAGEAIPAATAKKTASSATEKDVSVIQTIAQALKVEQGKIPATPLAKTLAAQQGISLRGVAPSGAQGEIRARDIPASGKASFSAKATPLAVRVAAAEGVDLSSVAGSGYGGKIVKDDVLGAIQQEGMQPIATVQPLKGMRKVIAARMLKSHTEIPPVTMNARADVTELTALREQVNSSLELKITFNDFVLCAVSRVFAQMGELNVAFVDGGIARNSGIHIGFAVALENSLIVPVIRNTDSLSLREISAAAKALSAKARAGSLAPDDCSGGTFTVSNLGMYGIRSFTPIINQPETMILGVCAIEPQLVMKDGGAIEKRLFMGLSLTFDHRALDGAQAAVFLQRVIALLERPLSMLV